MNRCWFLLFCIVIWACNETSKAVVVNDSTIVASQKDTAVGSRAIEEEQSGNRSGIDCDEALNRMFQTSNYTPLENLQLSGYRIHISDEPGDDGSLGINVYHISNGDSALLGILNLDLETGTLIDLSPSRDSVLTLTYDSSWLKIIRKQCGQ
ncbi:hypothetical protein SAMN05428949_5123 [Chitinophaga sp. YR627]|uniref:hypothetical protein n=1 Tax=Chitinophaga sp. YR627 TaxID=1881041 RepID=UPI0008E31801|nr:hypothetical protein [Chitinophaga sp. YR627]SFO43758.1 hypothetical protein SAMN05428949_5123 [Chitinophaga sp. YR627]